MKSWWMNQADGALELRDVPEPKAAAGQLVVRMHAASLNRGELLLGHGGSGWKPLGGEGAGEVVAVGEGVQCFAPGARVMGRCAGAFAGHALMEAAEALPMPDSLSWEEGASIPLTFLVTFDMLVLQGRLKAGEWLLVNGVSSGVGVACLQLGKVLGARVIGTSGSQDKLDKLKSLGLDVGLCTRAADFAPAVMEATAQHGADLVVDAVGGSVFAEDLRCMAFEGRLAIVGHVDRQLEAPLDVGTLHSKRLTLFGVSNRLRSKAQRASGVPRFIAEVMPHIASGRIRVEIDRRYAFGQLPEARAWMEAGAHTGKIVLLIPEGGPA